LKGGNERLVVILELRREIQIWLYERGDLTRVIRGEVHEIR
jgi:hypothetical protein